MAESRARPVGINHVAIAVGDVEEALAFYGDIFEFELRGRTDSTAFVDMGDQFLALAEGEDGADGHRHFGLVVDDAAAVERALEAADAERLDTAGLDFLDPWRNRVQVVAYRDVQFSKADHVREAMGLSGEKSAAALAELEAKGMAPE